LPVLAQRTGIREIGISLLESAGASSSLPL
jgi:hypothetical protein